MLSHPRSQQLTRLLATRTGESEPFVAGGASTVTSVWDKRGAVSAVTSSYGELVTRVSRDEQGRVTEIVYADAAKTTTQMVYDLRGRLVSTQTFRSKPSWWGQTGALPASGSPANYRAPVSADPVQ